MTRRHRNAWLATVRSAPLGFWVGGAALIAFALIVTWAIGPRRTARDVARCRDLYARAASAADTLAVDSVSVQVTVSRGRETFPDRRCVDVRGHS